MNIALIGYGNMGREIEAVIKQSDHKLVSVSFQEKQKKLDLSGIQKADVAIDFTSPPAVLATIKQVLPLGINMVIGTTGWYDHLSEVETLVKKTKRGVIYGGNFSVGANIFFQIVKHACQQFAKIDTYDVAGLEMHHTGKKDSPSGTAKALINVITQNFPRKKNVELNRLDRQIRLDELHFVSLRVGHNFGHHQIVFDSFADEVTITHRARNRRGFAEGALLAAEFIQGENGLYSFDKLFQEGVIV